MFEIGKTYTLKNINAPIHGEILIKEKWEERGVRFLCAMKLHVNFMTWEKSRVILSDNLCIQTLLDTLHDYWETEEGYIQISNTNGQPITNTFKQVDAAEDIIVIENMIVKYVDNLDLVEKLGEKLNQKSLPARD
jgi:hypothetical protein